MESKKSKLKAPLYMSYYIYVPGIQINEINQSKMKKLSC